jgi:hypothetical protein
MWAQDRDGLPPNVKRTISLKKTIFSAYFSRCGFVSVEFVPMGQKYNSQFFIETVLPSIGRNLRSVVRNSEQQQLTFMLTTPNHTPRKCPLKRLKIWAASWCLSHSIPPTSHRATSFCSVT